MRRAFGFQQQRSYGMHHEAQQQSHSMHQEATWHSKDDYNHNHNHFSGVQIVPSICLDSQFMKFHDGSWLAQNMNQNGWSGSGSGTTGTYYSHASASSGKNLLPFMGVTKTSQFSDGAMFNNAMGNAEYETSFCEVHVPATMRGQEIRYERSSIWGEDDGLQYQYCHGFDDNAGWKRNGRWKSEWISKGL